MRQEETVVGLSFGREFLLGVNAETVDEILLTTSFYVFVEGIGLGPRVLIGQFCRRVDFGIDERLLA